MCDVNTLTIIEGSITICNGYMNSTYVTLESKTIMLWLQNEIAKYMNVIVHLNVMREQI